ncbi:MAG: hypothetical protein ACTSV1_03295, partial [Alphaproteobacteria bacterium]
VPAMASPVTGQTAMADSFTGSALSFACPTLDNGAMPCAMTGGSCYACAQTMQADVAEMVFSGTQSVSNVFPSAQTSWSARMSRVDPEPPKRIAA